MRVDWKGIKHYVANNLEVLLVPIFFLIFLFIIKEVWGYFQLPTQEYLISNVQNFFVIYGLWLVFVASIVEATLFIGLYFPGSLVIFLAVAATHGNPLLASKTVLVVTLGMLVGYTINYMLGKYGWYKLLNKFGFQDELLKIEKSLKEKGILHSFIFYVMPGFGSFLSTAFGILKFSYITFFLFALIAVTFWNSVWGILVYFFGMPLFKLLTNTATVFVIFCVYFVYMLNKEKEKNEKGN